jgi:hypothetical protein
MQKPKTPIALLAAYRCGCEICREYLRKMGWGDSHVSALLAKVRDMESRKDSRKVLP